MKKIQQMLLIAITTLGIYAYNERVVYAEDNLEIKEVQIQELENEITTALAEINEHRLASKVLSNDIDNLLVEQQTLQAEIENQQLLVEEREDFLKKHLVSMQISNFAHNGVMQLINAENFTDFVNRLMIIGQLFNAEETTINSIVDEIAKLEDMQAKSNENQQILVEKQEKVQLETTTMTASIHELQSSLSENKTVFNELMNRKAAEEQAKAEAEAKAQAEKEAAEEQAKAEAEAKAQAEKEAAEEQAKAEAEAKAQAEKEAANDSSESESVVVKPDPQPEVEAPVEKPEDKPEVKPTPESNNEGFKVVSVEATAYSYQEAGLTHHTASGIDLRENPMVIAVDPNFIPLGTLVEIPGYGIAIAGDTGGAIKGNRIDVHFKTVQECYVFGRRQMEIKVFR